MTKPDLVICWPRNCDYPLWRAFIHDNRERFNVVIIIFTETNQGEDYREFVKENLINDWVLSVNSPKPNGIEDWRNVAINHGLLQSYNAEWIWFTEQDFFPLNDFWEEVANKADQGAQVIGVKEGERLHPCSMFIKREVLNKTDKDFGIIPDKEDHFSKITKNLEAMGANIELISRDHWFHMNGLSHNLSLIERGEIPTYGLDEFIAYLYDCLYSGITLDWRFKTLATSFLERVGDPNPALTHDNLRPLAGFRDD